MNPDFIAIARWIAARDAATDADADWSDYQVGIHDATVGSRRKARVDDAYATLRAAEVLLPEGFRETFDTVCGA